MEDRKIIEVELKRTDIYGRKKLFHELMEDLHAQVQEQLEIRNAKDSNFILVSIADNYRDSKLPIKLVYRITEKPVSKEQEFKAVRNKHEDN